MQKQSIVSLTLISLIFSLTGCAATSIFKFGGDQFPKSGADNPVIRILGLWQPVQGPGLHNETARGFAGQILFFDRRDDAPAQVDGDVTVFVFGDEGPLEEQVKPVHTVNFSAKAWNTHLYKGSLGATYDVFIPYTKPGIMEVNCTIQVRYTPKGSSPLYSEMVNVVLPGKKKPKPAAPAGDDGALESGDETAATGDRGAVREPPHARGISQAIPGLEEIDKLRARRPKPVELTEQERERILRDVKARLDAEQKRDVELASYEDHESKPVRRTMKPSRRRPARNPPLEDDGNDPHRPNQGAQESNDARDAENPGDSSVEASEPQRSGRGHVLDDDAPEPEETTAVPAATTLPGSQQRSPRYPGRHVLDEGEDE